MSKFMWIYKEHYHDLVGEIKALKSLYRDAEKRIIVLEAHQRNDFEEWQRYYRLNANHINAIEEYLHVQQSWTTIEDPAFLPPQPRTIEILKLEKKK